MTRRTSGAPAAPVFGVPAKRSPLAYASGQRGRIGGRRAGRVPVLEQDLFREALVRERRRADRFNQPFLLLRLTVAASTSEPARWGSLLRALADASRATDVLGWFEHGSVLGAILPELDATDPSVVRNVEARVRRALASKLDAATVSRCVLTLHVHTASTGARTKRTPADRLLRSRGRRPWIRSRLKRAMDVCGSAALLGVLSPVLAMTAAAVKLTSPGPAFYRQTRVGQRGTPFTMLKFRTMQADADEGPHQQYATQFVKSEALPVGRIGGEAVFKLTNDGRITSIGHFLRRTSIDELPQFWNVLRGEMSLVGPRPPLPYEVKEYKPWHCRRVLDAKPGVTGLWQVEGRSRTTFDEMVRLDLRYARTCSFWTDIRILLATPRAVIMGRGAR